MCPSPLKCPRSAVGHFSIWTGSSPGCGRLLWGSSKKNNVKRRRAHLLEGRFKKRQVFHRKRNEGMSYSTQKNRPNQQKHAQQPRRTDSAAVGETRQTVQRSSRQCFTQNYSYYHKELRTNMMVRRLHDSSAMEKNTSTHGRQQIKENSLQ